MYQPNIDVIGQGRVGGCHDQFGRWIYHGPCRRPPMMMPYRYPYASFRFGGDIAEQQPIYEPFRSGGVSKKTRQINMKRGCSLKTKKPIGASCVRVVNKALKVGRCKLTKNEQRVCRTLKAKRKPASKPVIYNKPKPISLPKRVSPKAKSRSRSNSRGCDFDVTDISEGVGDLLHRGLTQEQIIRMVTAEIEKRYPACARDEPGNVEDEVRDWMETDYDDYRRERE